MPKVKTKITFKGKDLGLLSGITCSPGHSKQIAQKATVQFCPGGQEPGTYVW